MHPVPRCKRAHKLKASEHRILQQIPQSSSQVTTCEQGILAPPIPIHNPDPSVYYQLGNGTGIGQASAQAVNGHVWVDFDGKAAGLGPTRFFLWMPLRINRAAIAGKATHAGLSFVHLPPAPHLTRFSGPGLGDLHLGLHAGFQGSPAVAQPQPSWWAATGWLLGRGGAAGSNGADSRANPPDSCLKYSFF